MEAFERRRIALDALFGCLPRDPTKKRHMKHETKVYRRDGKHVTGATWSQCKSKASYSSRRLAEKVAAKAENARGVKLRIYACDICGGYHISKRFRENEKKQAEKGN